MALGGGVAALTGALGRLVSRIKPVRRGDGEKADVAPVFGEQACRGYRLGRDNALIRDDDARIGPGRAQPVSAIDDVSCEISRHGAGWLLKRARREPQIDRTARLIAQPG